MWQLRRVQNVLSRYNEKQFVKQISFWDFFFFFFPPLIFSCMHYLVVKLFSKWSWRMHQAFRMPNMCIAGILKGHVVVRQLLHSSVAPKHCTEGFFYHRIDRRLCTMTDSITAKRGFYFGAVKHLSTCVLSLKSGIYQTHFVLHIFCRKTAEQEKAVVTNFLLPL